MRIRLIAIAAAALFVVGLGLFIASRNVASCAGPCPAAVAVNDRFWFLHRELGREGSITARLTSMTGTITYPPPGHDEIVAGLVPWAKTGIIVKDGVRQGSPYAALMATGAHGLRFQHGYTRDVAVGGSSPWMRLTRSGDRITAAVSADGSQWRTVASATLDGLPDTVQVGLFATSPGDLTLRKVMLGGAIEEVRFTQAVGVFDHVEVTGGADAAGGWVSEPVGDMNRTDWEKFHNPSGAVEKAGVFTVSGTGDIGPAGQDGPPVVPMLLTAMPILLIVVLVAGAGHRGRVMVLAAAALGAGLVAAGVTIPAGIAILHRNGVPALLPFWTGLRLVGGLAVALALCAVFAYGLRRWLGRRWAAILVALVLVALPYTVATLPILPDTVADRLLQVTPAAGFAVQQVLVEYPQVTAHYAPSAGYFPLPWWAGLGVLSAYAMLALLLGRARRSS
ncbi:hypothetical protein AB0M20_26975 [Actinoplanes sp. NPDC051633]|uniref:hypothetical protein n=1 Tax=Actinoplanes sp. NPDC051633 TaxID=3155670 RepID=UPI0034488A8C